MSRAGQPPVDVIRTARGRWTAAAGADEGEGAAGVRDVRHASDRPGREYVFIAERSA
jgi:hypothetical protein